MSSKRKSPVDGLYLPLPPSKRQKVTVLSKCYIWDLFGRLLIVAKRASDELNGSFELSVVAHSLFSGPPRGRSTIDFSGFFFPID